MQWTDVSQWRRKQLRFDTAKVEYYKCARANFWPRPQFQVVRMRDCALGGVCSCANRFLRSRELAGD